MTEFRIIQSPEAFYASLQLLSEQVGLLAETICEDKLTVPILKLFAHSDSEYDFIKQQVLTHGEPDPISSATSLYVRVTSGLRINNTAITFLGVRRPDPDRPQLGSGDFVVPKFALFTSNVAARHPDGTKLITNAHGLSMLELRHPDFNVLGYVIPG